MKYREALARFIQGKKDWADRSIHTNQPLTINESKFKNG